MEVLNDVHMKRQDREQGTMADTVWRPQDRWSAERALEHKCWLPIAPEQNRRYDDPAEAARGKKALLEDLRSDPHGQYLHA